MCEDSIGLRGRMSLGQSDRRQSLGSVCGVLVEGPVECCMGKSRRHDRRKFSTAVKHAHGRKYKHYPPSGRKPPDVNSVQACPGGQWVQQYTGVRQALKSIVS